MNNCDINILSLVLFVEWARIVKETFFTETKTPVLMLKNCLPVF